MARMTPRGGGDGTPSPSMGRQFHNDAHNVSHMPSDAIPSDPLPEAIPSVRLVVGGEAGENVGGGEEAMEENEAEVERQNDEPREGKGSSTEKATDWMPYQTLISSGGVEEGGGDGAGGRGGAAEGAGGGGRGGGGGSGGHAHSSSPRLPPSLADMFDLHGLVSRWVPAAGSYAHRSPPV